MALSTEESGRLAALLSGQDERVTTRWTEIVASSLRGRLSQAELRRQVQDLHRAIVTTGEQGTIDLSAEQRRRTARRALRAVPWPGPAGLLRHRDHDQHLRAQGRAGRAGAGDRRPDALRDYVAFSSWSTRWACSPSRASSAPARA